MRDHQLPRSSKQDSGNQEVANFKGPKGSIGAKEC